MSSETSQRVVGAALVPVSAAALAWATFDGERLWSAVVLSWIVGLWLSSTRLRRSANGV